MFLIKPNVLCIFLFFFNFIFNYWLLRYREKRSTYIFQNNNALSNFITSCINLTNPIQNSFFQFLCSILIFITSAQISHVDGLQRPSYNFPRILHLGTRPPWHVKRIWYYRVRNQDSQQQLEQSRRFRTRLILRLSLLSRRAISRISGNAWMKY